MSAAPERIELPKPTLPAVRSLFDINAASAPESLLGDRFLCRGSGMLLVGPSGIGKSSTLAQMQVAWALGRPAFGISPSGPLKTLVIQSEDDDGDLTEMKEGIIGGMGLGADDIALARENALMAVEKERTGALFLAGVVKPLVEAHRPDILVVNPFLAYLGDDPSKPEVTAAFLRNRLNPIIDEAGCGVILGHHTPKANNRDTSRWRAGDWMYAGHGSADVTNWARAVLVIEPTEDSLAFRFMAAKRGRRVGWCNDTGDPVTELVFCHARAGEGIFWRPAEDGDIARMSDAAGRKKTNAVVISDEALMVMVPGEGIPKTALLHKWNEKGMGRGRCRDTLEEMVADGRLVEDREKRAGTNPLKVIRRAEESNGRLAI